MTDTSNLFIRFNNEQLSFDIQKIESFDVPITIAKSHEPTFDYQFALDVECTSYWYAEQKERDEDFMKLKSIFPRFSFIDISTTNNSLYPTDWVIYDKFNDNPLQDSYGRVLIFGDKREADDDCRGNESVIRCTDLPIHWQETILKQLNNL